MSLTDAIFTVISAIIAAFFLLGALGELWKKLWIATVGEVLAVNRTSRYVPNEGTKLAVAIRYRFVSKNHEYIHEEAKQLDVKYYEEKEAMDAISAQFPVKGKIVVYHPKSMPSISSITPGGAAFSKLLTSFLLLACYLYIQYKMFSHFP